MVGILNVIEEKETVTDEEITNTPVDPETCVTCFVTDSGADGWTFADLLNVVVADSLVSCVPDRR